MNKFYFLQMLMDKNISQRKLAHMLGVNKDTLNNWINGHSVPGIDRISEITVLLKIEDADTFFRIFFPDLLCQIKK